jgi:hypothetical protein
MGVQKKKTLDPYSADDEDINDLDQLVAPVKNIEVNPWICIEMLKLFCNLIG